MAAREPQNGALINFRKICVFDSITLPMRNVAEGGEKTNKKNKRFRGENNHGISYH